MESSSPKVSRAKMIENSRANFYKNITQTYKENKDAPILMAPTKPTRKQNTQKPHPAAKQPTT